MKHSLQIKSIFGIRLICTRCRYDLFVIFRVYLYVLHLCQGVQYRLLYSLDVGFSFLNVEFNLSIGSVVALLFDFEGIAARIISHSLGVGSR